MRLAHHGLLHESIQELDWLRLEAQRPRGRELAGAHGVDEIVGQVKASPVGRRIPASEDERDLGDQEFGTSAGCGSLTK